MAEAEAAADAEADADDARLSAAHADAQRARAEARELGALLKHEQAECERLAKAHEAGALLVSDTSVVCARLAASVMPSDLDLLLAAEVLRR